MEITEIVNDVYWLDYAKKSVQNSISTTNDAAAKLEKMVLWFWGLYTATFTIGITINLLDVSVVVLLLLASPIVSLIVTYWLCVWAQLPFGAKFDPRIPYEIKEAFNKGVKVKRCRLNCAIASTLISAILLASALFSLSLVHKKDIITAKAIYSADKSIISISGVLPKNTEITTIIDTMGANNQKMFFSKNICTTSENSFFNVNIPIQYIPKTAIISITWKEGDLEKGLLQTLRNK